MTKQRGFGLGVDPSTRHLHDGSHTEAAIPKIYNVSHFADIFFSLLEFQLAQVENIYRFPK
jgi:hypothetical protein